MIAVRRGPRPTVHGLQRVIIAGAIAAAACGGTGSRHASPTGAPRAASRPHHNRHSPRGSGGRLRLRAGADAGHRPVGTRRCSVHTSVYDRANYTALRTPACSRVVIRPDTGPATTASRCPRRCLRWRPSCSRQAFRLQRSSRRFHSTTLWSRTWLRHLRRRVATWTGRQATQRASGGRDASAALSSGCRAKPHSARSCGCTSSSRMRPTAMPPGGRGVAARYDDEVAAVGSGSRSAARGAWVPERIRRWSWSLPIMARLLGSTAKSVTAFLCTTRPCVFR